MALIRGDIYNNLRQEGLAPLIVLKIWSLIRLTKKQHNQLATTITGMQHFLDATDIGRKIPDPGIKGDAA